MYDSQGVPQKVFYNFTKLPAANAWTLDIVHANGVTLVSNAAVTFDAAGALTAPASRPLPAFTPAPAATLPQLDRTRSPSTCPAMTQFGGANTITAPEQDGFALGSLQSFQLGNDGTIMGVYSNGLRQPLGQLALASFNNPGGLEKAGSSSVPGR